MERVGIIGGRRSRRFICWSKECRKDYDELSRVRICATRGADIPTLAKLGIREDIVIGFFTTIGMAKIITFSGPIYPDLVTKFLASCNLTFKNKSMKAEDRLLTFFLQHRFYKLTINEFCDVYEFPHHSETILGRIPEEEEFWNTIASSKNGFETARKPEIRNPTLWIVAKILGHTLLFNMRTYDVSGKDISILYYGIKHLLSNIAELQEYGVNLGGVLARLLVDYRLSPKDCYQKFHCGTLLTPLFESLYIDISQEREFEEIAVSDTNHLIKSDVMKSSRQYCLNDPGGNEWMIDLPIQEATSLLS